MATITNKTSDTPNKTSDTPADSYAAYKASAIAAVESLGQRGAGRYAADNGIPVELGRAGTEALARLRWPVMRVGQASGFATYQRSTGRSAGPVRRTKYSMCTALVRVLLQSRKSAGDLVVLWDRMMNDPEVMTWPNMESLPQLLGVISGKLNLKIVVHADGRIETPIQ